MTKFEPRSSVKKASTLTTVPQQLPMSCVILYSKAAKSKIVANFRINFDDKLRRRRRRLIFPESFEGDSNDFLNGAKTAIRVVVVVDEKTLTKQWTESGKRQGVSLRSKAEGTKKWLYSIKKTWKSGTDDRTSLSLSLLRHDYFQVWLFRSKLGIKEMTNNCSHFVTFVTRDLISLV